MRRYGNRLFTSALVVAGMVGLSGGCDDTRQADRRVDQAIKESATARLAEDGLEKAQSLLKQANSESEASPANRAQAKSLLGYAQMDAAYALVNDPEKGVAKGNREIARIVWELGQLAQQIQTSNNLVASYRQFEPKDVKAAAATQASLVVGGADQPVWIGDGATAIPTLTAAQKRVAELQEQIAKQQQDLEAVQAQRQQASAQAAQLQQQSNSQQGAQAVETFRQAAAQRKAAADAQVKADVQASALARSQQDLALAEAQVRALTDAQAQFASFGKHLDETWSDVQKQVAAQRQLATKILSEKDKSSTIAAKAAKLAEIIKQTDESYTAAEQNLTDAIESFQGASSAATQLKAEVGTAMTTLPGDNPMAKALKTLTEVYNPNLFKLSEANATLALAELQTARAQSLAERQKLIARLTTVLKRAGLTLPPALNDPQLADALKKVSASAEKSYTDALDLYTNAEGGGMSDSDRNASKAGRIYALYGQALLGRATGNKKLETTNLKEAKAQRDLILQEDKNALAALPAELVVIRAATTAPASAPAPAPAPAPAEPAAPAEAPAAAPADAAAPAPAPADQPAPAPAEPAPAPAEPAPAPAEPAPAPAAP